MGSDLMYLTYETKTGAICGQSTSLPPAYPGYSTIAVPISPDLDASYVDAGAIKSRIAIDWSTIAGDAWISVNDAAATIGFVMPTAVGVWRLRAVGKYRGELTLTIQTPAEVEATLVDQAKSEGERRRMLVMSPGGSKKTVYSLKQSEVDSWNDLGSTVATALAAFLGLSLIKQKRKFRFAMAEAAFRGEANPAAAIARFAAGSDAANAEAARIEAIEQAGVTAIKAATTIAAKRAAYTAINWNWSA
ncbi:hypothetical protein [Sphingomonas sp. PP-CC-3A-396]|uniref:hypothetical protein n=1 Tax=Sphingomonas sp. PP-CC-3A-396 TaxID=2135655 RepID=UPI0010DD63E6|nr:hypothetical protein [Sphingomonas sp. PP-CC-3A-396]TCQ04117.1 hypothetical protein C8J40_109252 [Sphingomonas sp. PP-CC-3A-396]